MVQYNISNVKLSNLELRKLKLGIKNCTEVTLNILLNFVGNSNDETSFPHKLVLTNTQVSKISKASPNDLSANIKLLKTQLSKMIQLGRFLPSILLVVKNPEKVTPDGAKKYRI